MTPIVAAASRTMNRSVAMKTSPAPRTSRDPRASIRRRPYRSACVLIHNEMAVSPTSVSVSNSPICVSSRPSADKYRARTTARKP